MLQSLYTLNLTIGHRCIFFFQMSGCGGKYCIYCNVLKEEYHTIPHHREASDVI